uniref:Rac/Cdc42 guanine nucleotide exchange factor 6 n=1 Tax=Salmo trutta TaxID=8032 RepID=A0A674AUV7_SALTR
MNPEEQTVTWLISLGVLNSPKKNIADPEEFLKTSLKDGVVLCKLMERLVPGSVPKYCQDPRNEPDCIANIKEFLRGCTSLKVEGFEPECLYTGENFNKVLTTLLGVNFATQGQSDDCIDLLWALFRRMQSYKTFRSKCTEMSENGGGGLLLVKARFQFKQNNEDELSFNKGDLIGVSRQEEGGWWEGSLNGKTGWFPSNYVREVKPCDKPVSPKATQLTKNYYSVVVQDIQEHEREFVKELQTVLSSYLRPLLASDKNNPTVVLPTNSPTSLCACCRVPESQQRVAACYLNLIGQIRMLYLSYCSSHPSAVCVLTDHSEELGTFMESQGASTPGILTLTTSLSKPFMRLDKYPVLLQELERHVEEAHPDYSDILKATVAFKSLCQDLRKRKNLELQILSEPVRGWEGDGMKSLGHVAYMSQVHMQNGTNEEKEERYLMMFPSVLVMLSASPRMSGFIYQGRLPLTGSTVSRQTDDTENGHYAFDITGSMFDRVTVFCSNPQELQDWLDHLNAYTKGGSPVAHCIIYCFKDTGSANRGPLEPPKTTKPWSLSCLRPAPPLKPSAALGYKERMSYILKDSGKSPRPIKKFLPKRKTDRKPSDDEFLLRKSTAALEEDAQILKVIESYCTGASLHQNNTAVRKDSVPQVLLPEEEKMMVEEMKNNGVCECVCFHVFAEVQWIFVYVSRQESKWIKQCLEDEQKSRKELERVVRKLAKQKNDCAWEDGDH